MASHDTMSASAPSLRQRPVYGPLKRAKRRILKTFGRWTRVDYDIQYVCEDGQVAYKKILFNSPETAERVVRNLEKFGPTEHLPNWRRAEGRALWIDFVEGRPCNRAGQPDIDAIARCFTEFAGRYSYRQPTRNTGYWSSHCANLDQLADHGLLSANMHRAILARSEACCPDTLRIGFDYRDPIAPNLVERADTGRICAIDVKNWHADTLVGQGLAKTTDRWLNDSCCGRILDFMSDRGLGDVAASFDFIRLFERIDRLRRRADTEFGVHGRIRKRDDKQARLAALV